MKSKERKKEEAKEVEDEEKYERIGVYCMIMENTKCVDEDSTVEKIMAEKR